MCVVSLKNLKKSMKTTITTILFIIASLSLTAQEDYSNISLEETLEFIKDIGENYNYDSAGGYLSKPYKNTKATVSYDPYSGILKMSNMAAYRGNRGESNFDIVMNLKKINPDWIRGFKNRLDEKFSGFVVELPDEIKDNILIEEGEYVKKTSIANFEGDTGRRLAKALKHACSLLYDDSSVKKFKF